MPHPTTDKSITCATLNMLIIQGCWLEIKPEGGADLHFPENFRMPECPLCGWQLMRRGSVPRHTRGAKGEKIWYEAIQSHCPNCQCWHRILPETSLPFKHYPSREIQDTIDAAPDADVCAAADSTMRWWRATFAAARGAICALLAGVAARVAGRDATLFDADRAIARAKAATGKWLARVVGLLIGGGCRICGEFRVT
jgi:hypothetical protein